jgi:hypothetical protein
VSKVFKTSILVMLSVVLLTIAFQASARTSVTVFLSGNPFVSTGGAMEEEVPDPYDYTIDMADHPLYEEVSENDAYTLFLDRTTYNIAVLVKETGYVWFSTDPDYDGIDSVTGREHNSQTQNRIRSPLSFRTTQFETISGDFYLLNERHDITITFETDGFVMHVELTSMDLAFDVRVTIDSEGLSVHVPFDAIREGDLRLQSIRVYPGLGMTTGDDMTGYMFIPDGSGALVRYTTGRTGLAYSEFIYGADQGYQTLSQERVLATDVVPAHQNRAAVLGIVHGVGKNAMMATIEEGAEYAQIRADAKNNVTKYFQNAFSFNYRLLYFRPTNNQGDGFRITSETMIETDARVRYTFLSDDDADYVGMAKAYRQTLIQKGMTPVTPPTDLPVFADIVGTDVTSGLFSKKTVVMTTYDEARAIALDLRDDITSEPRLGYRMKSTDGTYVFGYDRKAGSRTDYQTLLETVGAFGHDMVMQNETVFRPDASSGIAKQVGGVIMGLLSRSPVWSVNYLMDMQEATAVYQDALSVMEEDNLGFHGIFSGQMSYTHVDSSRNLVHRDVMHDALRSQFESMGDHTLLLENPLETFYPYVDMVSGIPVSSSGYAYITDTVPFIEIALSGLVEMYGEPLNTVANRDIYILKMIEYGLYPSYVLTHRDAYLLRGSDDTKTYTSEYALWKPMLLNDVRTMRSALQPVMGHAITGHRYMGNDVYVTTYENGFAVAVNYSDVDVLLPQGSVPAMGTLRWEVLT